ncbi:hypothetical protein [Falsiroseomonas sp.]|uniref:hypothetical protein n=1 Tax=Falsiroseomonas sp. TaxID=2870721 RepID=UPI002718FB52|nr:hypothetical protein [Falsiroseomonas sp.]MDO9499330.1 hypothetical protein [Falsiroseomonas sp.]
MPGPTAAELLELVERGAALGAGARALLLLRTAHPGIPAEVISVAPLSARDRALLGLRAALFGRAIRCREHCDACGEVLDLDLTAEALGLGEAPHAFPAAPHAFPPAPHGTLPDGTPVRALSAADAAAAEGAPDMPTARAILRSRAAPDAADGPELDAALEALDPDARVVLDLLCPACGTTATRELDVPRLVWCELEARIPRLLREVAEIARVFHWSERDILALPPARRAFYLAEARG